MKKYIHYFIQFILFFAMTSETFADGSINAFYKATVEGNITEVAGSIKTELENSGFKYLGDYSPARNSKFHVIAYTSDDLMQIALQTKERGALAGVLRIGLIAREDGKVDISFLNPTYIFYSFLRDDFSKNEEKLNEIQMMAMMAIASIGARPLPFGAGSLTESELKNFRFMVRMPSFDDPVTVQNFNSFQEGVNKIQANLRKHKGGTTRVYELISDKEQVAVFGVGLLDTRLGESKFLPILGEEQLAALPYEIVLQGKTATILNGRYRFPLFWSHLTMREFHKIGRTNRDIQYMMENLTK